MPPPLGAVLGSPPLPAPRLTHPNPRLPFLPLSPVVDESEEFERLSVDCDYYVPVIHLYYNDDLTVA